MKIRRKSICAILIGLAALTCWSPEKCSGQAVPKEAQRILYEARQALDKKDYSRAQGIIGDYLKNTKSAHPLAYEILGNACYREGNLIAANKAFEKGFELAPDSFALCSNLATVAYELNDFKEAAPLFARAFELSKKRDADLLYRAAAAYAKAGRKQEANRALLELVGRKEEIKQPWLQLLIQTSVDLENWKEAEQYLTEYLDRFNTEHAYWKLLGQVGIKLKSYPAAAGALEVAYTLNEADPSDWKILANLYFSLDVPLQAVRCLERAYGANPTPEQCDELAKGYARALRIDLAIQQLDSAIRRQPSGPRYLELGKLYYRSGRWQDAIDALNAAIEHQLDSGLAHLLIGFSAAELGNLEAAGRAFKEAAKDQAYQAQSLEALSALQLQS